MTNTPKNNPTCTTEELTLQAAQERVKECRESLNYRLSFPDGDAEGYNWPNVEYFKQELNNAKQCAQEAYKPFAIGDLRTCLTPNNPNEQMVNCYRFIQNIKQEEKLNPDSIQFIEKYTSQHLNIKWDNDEKGGIESKIVSFFAQVIESQFQENNYSASNERGSITLSEEEKKKILNQITAKQELPTINYIKSVNGKGEPLTRSSVKESNDLGFSMSHYPELTANGRGDYCYNVHLEDLKDSGLKLRIYKYYQTKPEYQFDENGMCRACYGSGCQQCTGL